MPTMAAANPILPKHGSLTFTDGTGSPISMVVPYTEAIDLGEFNDGGGQEFAVHRNRGAVIAVVPSGVITENVIKCKVRISALKHATDLNILDWVRRKNSGSALTTTLPSANGGAETYTYKAKFTADPAHFSSQYVEYNYARPELTIAEGGSDDEAMTGELTLHCYRIGTAETDWMTVG